MGAKTLAAEEVSSILDEANTAYSASNLLLAWRYTGEGEATRAYMADIDGEGFELAMRSEGEEADVSRRVPFRPGGVSTAEEVRRQLDDMRRRAHTFSWPAGYFGMLGVAVVAMEVGFMLMAAGVKLLGRFTVSPKLAWLALTMTAAAHTFEAIFVLQALWRVARVRGAGALAGWGLFTWVVGYPITIKAMQVVQEGWRGQDRLRAR